MTQNLKNSIKTLVLGMVLACQAQAETKSCGTKGLGYASKAMLMAASASSNNTRRMVADRRQYISELQTSAEISAEALEAAREIARGSVEISDVRMGGELLNSGLIASGFLYGKLGCFVLSVRHGVNKSKEIIMTADGRVQVKPDVNHTPVGSTVKIRQNLMGGTPTVTDGTVVAVGSFASGLNGDFALIRLSKRSNIKAPNLAFGSDEEIVGKPLMSIGLPEDMTRNGRENEFVVDPKCRALGVGGVNTGGEGVATDCLINNGNSGGPVAARIRVKDGREVWAVIGMLTNGDGMAASAGQSSSSTVRNGAFLSLQKIDNEISLHAKASLAQEPCQ